MFYHICQRRGLIAVHRRPRSMVGGDLHWIWEPYGLYQEVDYVRYISSIECGWGTNYDRNIGACGRQVYGVKALQENSGFPSAQCKSPFIAMVARSQGADLTIVIVWMQPS
jgi:hypothetical protein